MALGGFLGYMPLMRLIHYVHNGEILFRHKSAAPVVGTEAAFWNLAYLGLALWAMAYGLILITRGKHPDAS